MTEPDNKREIMVLQNTIAILDYDKRMAENKLSMLKTKRTDVISYGNPMTRDYDRRVEQILGSIVLNPHVVDRDGGIVQRNRVVYRITHDGLTRSDISPNATALMALRELGLYISGMSTSGMYLSVI